MMGATHSLSGLAVGAATLPVAPVTGWVGQLSWVAAIGGMAMLPDLDQKGSTPSRAWGPITSLTARGLSKIAGGHREGTHDCVIAPLVFGGLAVLASMFTVSRIVLFALGIGLALRALAFVIPGRVEETIVGNLILSVGGAWWLTVHGHAAPAWLPVAVVIGVLVHIAGDFPTVGGVPVPFTWWRKGGPRMSLHAFKTGSVWETALLAPIFGLLACWQLYEHTGVRQVAEPVVRALAARLA